MDSWFDFFEFLVEGDTSQTRESCAPSINLAAPGHEPTSSVRNEPSFSSVMASIVSTGDPVESSEEDDEENDRSANR